MRRLLCSTLVLALLLTEIRGSAQAQRGPAFTWQDTIPHISTVKFPQLAATGSTVHLTANINRADVAYWAKDEAAPSYGTPMILGPAQDQPDYSTTSITAGPDGTLYLVWVNQPTRTISMRVKAPGQDWGPTREVSRGQPFPVFPQVAVTTDHIVTVVWRTPDRPFVYRQSRDRGETWGPITPISSRSGVNTAIPAAGPHGALAVAYTGPEGDSLHIFVAIWNGTGFVEERVSPRDGAWADPSLTFTPQGRLVVAWRGIADRGATSGVFFSERQADGSWPVARLIGGAVAGRVVILSDASTSLHVIWTGNAGNGFQVWYTTRPAHGSWTTPVSAPNVGGMVFNVAAAVATGSTGAVTVNAASEVFIGSVVTIRAYRFTSGIDLVWARPVLAGGAPASREPMVLLEFVDVAGDPTQVRMRWELPPTDATPWQPYARSMMVTLPPLRDAGGCELRTLYTQVQNAQGIQQTQTLSDTILADQGVQADLTLRGPAAPGYVNTPEVTVRIDGSKDCSGLAAAQVAGVHPAPVPITSPTADLTFAIPDHEGVVRSSIVLTDTLGNAVTQQVDVIYDRTPPTASYDEPLQITTQRDATVLQTIELRNAGYYDESGAPWGVAVAVSRTPITDPDALRWYVASLASLRSARILGSAPSTVTARVDVSLATFVDRANLTPGTYFYVIALVDKAGNRSRAVARGSITMERITYPTLMLPLMWR